MNRKGIFCTLFIETIDLRASKSLLPCLLIFDSENSLCSNNLLDECRTAFSSHVRFSLNPIFCLSPRFSISDSFYISSSYCSTFLDLLSMMINEMMERINCSSFCLTPIFFSFPASFILNFLWKKFSLFSRTCLSFLRKLKSFFCFFQGLQFRSNHWFDQMERFQQLLPS